MTTATIPVRLVYSYCHKDRDHLHCMKTALAPLRDQAVLEEWLDENIPPGRPITSSVKKKLQQADVVVFLLSSRFLNSQACMEEWRYAKQLEAEDPTKSRVPVLLAPCPWQDALGEDIKLLPNDANAISDHDGGTDRAWLEVYEGIKEVIEHIRCFFAPKPEFLAGMEQTELLSHEGIKLTDIFVLPPLTTYATHEHSNAQLLEHRIKDVNTLLAGGNTLIHGPEMCGKTALARYLFMHLSRNGDPVLFVDIKASHGAPNDGTFKTLYEQQFSGDYDLWSQSPHKTALVDNVDSAPRSRKFINSLKEHFERVVVFMTTDTFISYYRDDRTVADFSEVRLGQLTYVQQERLIRARLVAKQQDGAVSDGTVDQVEKQVDNIIHRSIVPRYPFYVLSIVQTFEGYMPSNLSITSYGHCYHALIVAKLIKAGVDRKDEDLNACFNFAEHLAFALYQAGFSDHSATSHDFNLEAFIGQYRATYVIPTWLLSRLRDPEYGIISDNGMFSIPYMYYYFLGKYLSGSATDEAQAVVEDMCAKSYVRSNHLTLLFVIHHATDNRVIDAIIRIASGTLRQIEPATLSTHETTRFQVLVRRLPQTVLNDGDVEQERRREREARDEAASNDAAEEDNLVGADDDLVEQVNDWYRMLKNNEILGQVLRSRYGRLTRDEITSTIETISEGGLRLVNYILKDEQDIEELARFFNERMGDDASYDQIVSFVRFASFVWTMTNIEQVVRCVNGANIREVLVDIVGRRQTPAYDLIGYFSQLDSARELNDDIKKRLRELLRRHSDPFIRAVLSLRTQHYMNTHRSERTVEQGVSDLLGIPPSRSALRRKNNARLQRHHRAKR